MDWLLPKHARWFYSHYPSHSCPFSYYFIPSSSLQIFDFLWDQKLGQHLWTKTRKAMTQQAQPDQKEQIAKTTAAVE